jgi:hypothetical protein
MDAGQVGRTPRAGERPRHDRRADHSPARATSFLASARTRALTRSSSRR